MAAYDATGKEFGTAFDTPRLMRELKIQKIKNASADKLSATQREILSLFADHKELSVSDLAQKTEKIPKLSAKRCKDWSKEAF